MAKFKDFLDKGGRVAQSFMLAAGIVAVLFGALQMAMPEQPYSRPLAQASLKCLAAASGAAAFLVRDYSGGLVIAGAGGCLFLSLLALGLG